MKTSGPVQLQISRSIPYAYLEFGEPEYGGNPEKSFPWHFIIPSNTESATPLGDIYFIDAPNVSHTWNIKNASIVIKNFQLNFFSTHTEPVTWEYSIEYVIRSAGVPVLVVIEPRSFTTGESEGFYKKYNEEIIANYEAVRPQYVIPGTGLELSIYFRNLKLISGNPTGWAIRTDLVDSELNINMERT